MEISLYQIDAFASKIFEGNPAAVCPLNDWLPDEIMQSIAQENKWIYAAMLLWRQPTSCSILSAIKETGLSLIPDLEYWL